MHILILPSRYMKPGKPMRGNDFREQAAALARREHQVGMIIPPSRFFTLNGLRETLQGIVRPQPDVIIEADPLIPTYRLSWWHLREALHHPSRLDLGLKLFDTYVQAHGMPDVLHARGILYGGFLGTAIKARFGIPLVVTEQDSNYLNGMIFPWQRPIIRDTLQQADHRLVMIPPMAENLQQIAGTLDIEVIGNSVNTEFFNPGPLPPTETPFTFILLGVLRRIKAIDLALRAFAQTFGGRNDVVFKIAGDGPERGMLMKLARELGIEQQVSFLGVLSREQTRDLMQSSHVLVSSSQHETFGNTLVEAMSCGKPVVATRSGGPQMIVLPGTGLLTPVNDLQALAEAFRTIHLTYDQYDPAFIRQSVVSRFSEYTVVDRLEAIYQQIVQ